MIQIEASEIVWRIMLDDPFPGDSALWERFINALNDENFLYGVDEDGPGGSLYVTTYGDAIDGDVSDVVERVLSRVLGIAPVAAEGEGQ